MTLPLPLSHSSSTRRRRTRLLLLAATVLLATTPFASAQSLLVSNAGTEAVPGENVLRFDFATAAFQGAFATGGNLSSPVGIAYGLDGDLYVVNGGDSRVLRFNGATGAFKSAFVVDAGLTDPYGLTFGPNGDLFVADIATNAVRRYDGITGAFVSIFASGGGLDFPTYLVFGPKGDLFVSSQNTNQVLRYDGTTGAFKSVFASGGGLVGPFGLAFGPSGDLFVANGGSFYIDTPTVGSVLRYDGTTGAFKSTFAASNNLLNPDGLTFGPDGDLFVSAYSGDQVLRFAGDSGAYKSVAASNPDLHSPSGLTFTPLVSRLQNIATRARVQTGDKVMIGGFIITGSTAKRVIIRGIGPSLQSNGGPFPGRLADPALDLYAQGSNIPMATNNDWTENRAAVEATGLAPTNDKESAIVLTLNPGSYTAVLHGADGGTGVAVVEAYDLDTTGASRLANLSTRGFVETGDNVLIGGVIVGPNPIGRAKVVVRAIGPSLQGKVPNELRDPTLELRDNNGALVEANDDWAQSPRATDLQATGLAPTNSAESAILIPSLPSGNYTAIVGGKGSTGIAVVEAYNLE